MADTDKKKLADAITSKGIYRMKTTITLRIGCFYVRGKYKNEKTFEDCTFKALPQFTDTKTVIDEIRKDYGEYNCTITDISLMHIKTAEINLAGEYLKAQKNSIADTGYIAMEAVQIN